MELMDFRSELLDEVKRNAAVNLSLDPEEFASVVMQELIESDECADFTPCYYEGESKRGKKIEIFGYDLDEDYNILSIVAVRYNGTSEPEKLNRTEILKIADRAAAFVVEAEKGAIQQSIDESCPARDLADLVYFDREKIEQYKIYVLTDNLKSDRIKHLETDNIDDKETTVYLWDIENLYNLRISNGGYDDHDIYLKDFGVEGIPCIKASLGDASKYDSYLCAIPGQLLCDFFAKYRGKLLESNVRSYLKSSKKNKLIRGTIVNSPDMFFAYNNGITATAIGLTTETIDGMLCITHFNSLQIVNGGQTTVSLFDVHTKDGADLSQVYVPMKLTVIPGAEQEDIVPNISKAANTQNTVSNADFFSNHPFHKKLHAISLKTRAPIAPGMPFASKWYYESARGQYAQQQLGMNKVDSDKFKMEYPKNQLITKTDLAKYRMDIYGMPHIVSKGQQDAFREFAKKISEQYEKSPDFVNERYFKESVAITIIYRSLEKIVSNAPWYEKGYRSQIINYSMAKLALMLDEHGQQIDYGAIWERQSISQELIDQFLVIGERVQISFNEDKKEANIAQWCKKPGCWEVVKNLKIPFTAGIQRAVISKGTERSYTRIARRQETEKRTMNDRIEVVNLGYEYWYKVYEWGMDHSCLEGLDKDFLQTAMKMEYGKLPSEKQSSCILKVRDKLRGYGMKL